MKVKFKILNKNAVMPKKAHEDDFCYDVVATSCEEIAPNVYKYGTGLALQIDDSDRKLMRLYSEVYGVTARPRSSIWKTGMVLSNSLGTIDAGYTGEITAVFYHVMPDMPRYKVGDRIFQIHISCASDLQFEDVDSLTSTDRGERGYGSTDKTLEQNLTENGKNNER